MYSTQHDSSTSRHETSSTASKFSSASLPDLLFDDDSLSESDIGSSVDLAEVEQDREAPARPTSRLGFNRALFEPLRLSINDEEDRSEETYRWMCTLLGSGGDSDGGAVVPEDEVDDAMEFVDVCLGDETNDSHSDTYLPCSSLPPLDGRMSAGPEDLDLGCSISVERIDVDIAEEDPMGNEVDLGLFPPPPSEAPMVSLPKVVSPRPVIAQPQPSPNRRMAFFLNPSPLSSAPTSPTDELESDYMFPPQSNPERHLYTHRGLSRHALCHLKWFWNVRQDRWAESQSKLDHCEAYGGLAPVPSSSAKMGKKCSRPTLDAPGPKPTTHPRVGDILSLRDSYSTQIDQYLWELPLWTMRKMLYVFDMEIGVERARRMKAGKSRDDSFCIGDDEGEDKARDEDDSESIPDCMHMSMSSDFSDSSDSTLVESECDLSRADPCAGSSLDIVDESQSLESSNTGKFASLVTFSPSFSPSLSSSSSLLPRHWESNWYARWELLIELIQQDQHRCGSLDHVPKSPLDSDIDFSQPSSSRSFSGATSGGVSLGVKSPFFYSEKGIEQPNEDDDDDFWNDEEEDYGVLVPNPVFGRVGMLNGGVR